MAPRHQPHTGPCRCALAIGLPSRDSSGMHSWLPSSVPPMVTDPTRPPGALSPITSDAMRSWAYTMRSLH